MARLVLGLSAGDNSFRPAPSFKPVVPNMVFIRLTRKVAERVQGVDLRAAREGDMLDLPPHEADALLRGDYAVRVDGASKKTRRAASGKRSERN
jgi:hypothetical protein